MCRRSTKSWWPCANAADQRRLASAPEILHDHHVSLNSDSGAAADARVTSGLPVPATPSTAGHPRDHDILGGPVGLSASMAAFGYDGAVIWSQRKSLLRMTDAVTAGTWWGAVKVVAWIAAVLGIAAVGQHFAPDLGGLWLLISVGIMLPVAIWIPKRRSSRRIT